MSGEPKPDVTYEDEVKLLFENINVTDQINSYCKERNLTPPKSYSYGDISDDNTSILIYNALKSKRFDKVNDLMNESNLFAAWIKEGRMEALDSDKKPEPTIKPDPGNSLTYRDIYSLFTNSDHFNMNQLNIPLHAAITSNPPVDAPTAAAYFETFKQKSDANAQTPFGRSIL
ncbi:6960_t:CDS:1, partial [Cetraspora pellucida]